MKWITKTFLFALLYFFFLKNGVNAAKICKCIWEIYGDEAVGESIVRKLFEKIKAKEFILQDGSRSWKPSKLDEDILKTKLEEN